VWGKLTVTKTKRERNNNHKKNKPAKEKEQEEKKNTILFTQFGPIITYVWEEAIIRSTSLKV
jgi:hypothetical protein